MVIMALDHTRDFFSGFKFDPTDLQHASSYMFFTRWITHFCAPVFIFLTGTSAYLSQGKNTSRKQASWKLFTRGLWLIVLEHTFVRLGWTFDLNYSIIFLQVIWAIGVSMICLSGLIFLPWPIILSLAAVMILGHNALDGLHNDSILWKLLHVQGPISYGHGNTVMVFYPLVPWIGVMAAGYCFGRMFHHHAKDRHFLFYITGSSMIVCFIVLRMIDGYGDPSPWSWQENIWRTTLSFVNCTKYPPSLCYLLMTLGPAIISLPLLEKMSGRTGAFFTVFGRVPLFYYILHLYVIHGLAVAGSALFRHNEQVSVFSHPGYTLVRVYLFWITAIAILYFPSRWFMHIKQNHRKWWLSYL